MCGTYICELHLFLVIDGGDGDLPLGHKVVVVDVVAQEANRCKYERYSISLMF